MVEKVGALADEAGAIAAHRLDDRLDGLLAELLRDLRGAAREQLCRVGRCRVGAAAVEDRGMKTIQDVIALRHDRLTAASGCRTPRDTPWPRRCGKGRNGRSRRRARR